MGMVFYWIHYVTAMGLFFYVFLPFFLTGLNKRENPEKHLNGLILSNRIGQLLLVVQLVSGGGMLHLYELSVLWIIVTFVLLIGLGAATGILGKNLKRLRDNFSTEGALIRKVSLLSWISLACFLLIVVIMYEPSLLG